MEPTVMAQSGSFALLANLVAGEYAGSKVFPFINDVDPQESAVIGDFTPATFTGSAAIAIAAWGEAFAVPNGGARSLGSLLQWDWDAGVAETIYGYVWTDATDNLIGYARRTTPKLMAQTTDSAAVVPVAEVGPDGYGTWIEVA